MVGIYEEALVPSNFSNYRNIKLRFSFIALIFETTINFYISKKFNKFGIVGNPGRTGILKCKIY